MSPMYSFFMRENIFKLYEDGKTISDTPSKILFCTFELYGESSLSNITVQDIASAAKCNIAAISYYFKGKECLYEEIINQIIEYFYLKEEPFIERINGLRKNPDSETAKQILFDWFSQRLTPSNRIMKLCSGVLNILSKEIIYKGKYAKTISDKILKKHNDNFAYALKIATRNRLDMEESKLGVIALDGVILKMSTKNTITYDIGITKIDRDKIKKTYIDFLNRIIGA